MNLLIMTGAFPPDMGGVPIYSDILARYLARKPDIKKIIILTRFTKRAPIIENRNKIKILRLLPPLIEPKVFFRKLIIAIPLIINSVILFFAIHLSRIDIVHIISPFTFWIPRLYRVPVIVDIQGYYENERYEKYKIMRISPDVVLSISKNVSTKLYLKKGRTRIRYIPMAFEPLKKVKPEYIQKTKEKYGIPPGSPYLCFACPIRAFKGIYELIDAFDIFLRAHPEYYLIIAGRNIEGERFEKRIKDNEHIIYVGGVPHDEALAIIQGSEMLVQPSEEADAQGYLTRNCLDAIALGTKVILPPNVQEAGKYCPDFVLNEVTPQAIADKIEEVLRLDKKPEYPFEELDAEKVVNEIYQLYKELVAK